MRFLILFLLLSISSSSFSMHATKIQKKNDFEMRDLSQDLPAEIWMTILYFSDSDLHIKDIITLSKRMYDLVKRGDYRGCFYAPIIKTFDDIYRLDKENYGAVRILDPDNILEILKQVNKSRPFLRRLEIKSNEKLSKDSLDQVRFSNLDTFVIYGSKICPTIFFDTFDPKKITALRIPILKDLEDLRRFIHLKTLVFIDFSCDPTYTDWYNKMLKNPVSDKENFLPHLTNLSIRYSKHLGNVFNFDKISLIYLTLKMNSMREFERYHEDDEFLKGIADKVITLKIVGPARNKGVGKVQGINTIRKHFKNLKYLVVKDHSLRCVDFDKLPKNLKYLDIRNNTNHTVTKKTAKGFLKRHKDGLVIKWDPFLDFGGDIDEEIKFYFEIERHDQVIRRYEQSYGSGQLQSRGLLQETMTLVKESYRILNERSGKF